MTTRVGIYRSYHGPVPVDDTGQPLPKREWPQKRPFSWVVRWFGINGDRYSRSFKSRKEANRFAETKQHAVQHGRADPPPRSTLRQFYEEHKALMKGNLRRSTLQMHVATITRLAQTTGWDRDLQRISVRDIEQYRAGRLSAGIAGSSANKEVKVLRRIFNLAIIRGYVMQGNNPCVGIPMIKVGRKRPTYCSPPQFQSILTGAPDSLRRALLVVLYTTALRLQEAMHLTWGDIDFAVGQLHVTRREAHGFVQRWEPKDHEMRTIPLPKQALDLLITWQAAAPENCPYVFMEAGRWEYYRQRVLEKNWPAHGPLVNNVLRRFKTLCKRAGVGPFTIHDLRRSCITNWGGRLPIHVVQQLAGHSDIRTTQQYYLSVQDDDLIKAKTLQQEIVGEVPPPATDQKLTKSGQKRQFSGRKRFQSLLQEPEL